VSVALDNDARRTRSLRPGEVLARCYLSKPVAVHRRNLPFAAWLAAPPRRRSCPRWPVCATAYNGLMPAGTWVPLSGALLALLCLWGALRAARRQRLIDDLPTCKTTGVFIGLVELKGTAESERPLVSYLTERPCVYYAWEVSEHWSRTVTERYTDKDGKTQTRTRRESGWKTVAHGGDSQPFYLKDEEGVIRVVPDGAHVEPTKVFDETCGRRNPLYYGKGPPEDIPDSDHRRRFTESAILLHAPVYVVGVARERTDVVAVEIAKSPDAPLFLISTRSEQQVRRGYAAQFWVLLILGLLVWVGAWFLRGELDAGPRLRGPPRRAETVWLSVKLGAAYSGVAALLWFWMAYNSLVDLRQRVQQAWANIDVQLKRRADLIPNLVRVIAGLRDHERVVQTAVAALRTQLAATPPGQPGPDPAGCAPALRAVVERYPVLRSDAAFMRLHAELVATEQRIALARDYFNASATFYNTRLQTFPDALVAWFGRLRPQALLSATAFERAMVTVQLAE